MTVAYEDGNGRLQEKLDVFPPIIVPSHLDPGGVVPLEWSCFRPPAGACE